MARRRTLYIVTNNHFDPIWRRCWDRRFTNEGRRFVSYAELEDYYLTDNLAIARRHPEYKFEAESTVVVRKYLERHPEKLRELRRLAAARRFAVTGGGENIVDSNMVLGESLVRNFLLGLLWVEQKLGQRTCLGVRNDAFGNSAQIPQIFRGCEIQWVTGFSYSPCRGNYWRGLDGSSICCASLPTVACAREAQKCRPCGECAGKGCRACRKRGIEPTPAVLPERLDLQRLRRRGCGIISMGYEENLPNPAVVAYARKLRKQYDARFAVEEDLLGLPWLRQLVARVDNPPAGEVCADAELNPNNSGTWVTRIKLKQACRRQEYALLAAEGLAALGALRGAAYPRADLDAAWRTLLFTMFHDAITATHVDAAYSELCDMWDGIETRTQRIRQRASKALVKPDKEHISVLNMTGGAATQLAAVHLDTTAASVSLRDEAGREVPVRGCVRLPTRRLYVRFLAKDVPPYGARVFSVTPLARPASRPRALPRPVIENERFRVKADTHGIVSVYDKRLKRDILRSGTYRPGELAVERDTGSPWATLEPDCSRMGIAEWTTLESAEATPCWQRLLFRFSLPYFSKCAWARGWVADGRMAVTLYSGLERVDLAVNADWDSYNGRVRVAFPVPARGRHCYGIPYGALERKPYKGDFSHWAGANGDWPAVNWAGLQAPAFSVALLNKGLPSYRLEQAAGATTIWLSLLRSPAVPTYLHEPQFYSMTAYDGMRDAGDHHFEYAVTAYDSPLRSSSVVNDAEGYNAGVVAVPGTARLPQTPQCDSDHVRISAVKMAEQGGGVIIRLWEYRGRGSDVVVRLPGGVRSVAKVNLLERHGTGILPASGLLEMRDGTVRFRMRAWEIATLRAAFSSALPTADRPSAAP